MIIIWLKSTWPMSSGLYSGGGLCLPRRMPRRTILSRLPEPFKTSLVHRKGCLPSLRHSDHSHHSRTLISQRLPANYMACSLPLADSKSYGGDLCSCKDFHIHSYLLNLLRDIEHMYEELEIYLGIYNNYRILIIYNFCSSLHSPVLFC